MEKLYTTKEFCEIVGIGRTSLYNYINAGAIEPMRIGRRLRFTDEHVKQLLNAFTKTKEGENEQ